MKKPLVFLDLDDTILDFHWAEQRALSRAFREAGLDPKPEILDRYSDINRSQWELLERGELNREQVLVRRFELLFEELGLQITASGGVSSLEDVESLRKMNLYGAIIGKAYYTGDIDLKKALEAAR